ncbi:hypothetical protein BC936DRAFT_140533 [Jimgerdemannia flammicorona]|uniref:Uncharacterized protein n=1 Tax=Jimgerdemannia flammicorona TaxID=994334 RepID=A0A433AQ86_9FUNG|nr:hypothetical protein BC936DRAFT_140533 [Jimgerdemannia flammicorona]
MNQVAQEKISLFQPVPDPRRFRRRTYGTGQLPHVHAQSAQINHIHSFRENEDLNANGGPGNMPASNLPNPPTFLSILRHAKGHFVIIKHTLENTVAIAIHGTISSLYGIHTR